MKKLLLALALICTMAVETMAQCEFHWGFKGGINFTTVDSDADDFQARMGQWGVLGRWTFGENKRFAAQTEIFYARMGVRSLRKAINWFGEHDGYYTKYDLLNQKFRLQYLSDNVQVPFLFKYYLPVNLFGTHGFNVHAGVLLSYRFDYKISTSSYEGFLLDPELGGNGSVGTSTTTNDVLSGNTLRSFARAANQFTVHAVYGIGYDSPSGIGLDIRCQMGITPVWDKDDQHAYNTNSHDRVWCIAFSYVF